MNYNDKKLNVYRTRKKLSVATLRLLAYVLLCRIDDPYLSKSSRCTAFTVPVALSKRRHHKIDDVATLFHSVNKNKEDQDSATNTSDQSNIGEYPIPVVSRIAKMDPLLVYTDVFAVVIACQLLGLLDVLNDTTFWINGGWFQPITPITTESSTLPIFLQRTASNAVCYIFITFVSIKGSYETGTALRSLDSILRVMISSIVTFTFTRWLAVAIWVLLALTPPISATDRVELITSHADQFTEILRESYFIMITITTGRVGLYKLFYTS